MNYSQFTFGILLNYYLLLFAVAVCFVASIIVMIFLVKQFIKQNAIHYENKRVLMFNNKESLIDFFGIIFSVVVIIFVLLLAKDVIADLPYAIKKDFSVTTGVVVAQDSSGYDDVSESRGIEIKDIESGKIIELLVYHTPIRRGEMYEVIYLPNSGVGAIVRKIDTNES